MKLLTRLGGGPARSGGWLMSFINRERRPLFQQIRRRRSSVIHGGGVPSRRHMAAVTCQAPAAAAADGTTRWTILQRWCCATDSTAVAVVAGADAKTDAEAHTSHGPLRVSLSRAAPPAFSFLCFDWAGGGESPDERFSHAVVAAHGDSALLRFGGDYFVYRSAGGHPPPSLSRLPACRVPMYEWEHHRSGEVYRTQRGLDHMDTGLLRLGDGDGEFLVAQLQVAYEAPFDTAELCVLRGGDGDWEFHGAVPIVHHDGGGRHGLGRWQELSAAVPAGNRFLCWVSYDHATMLVCDMAAAAAANFKLRYVPLPVKAVPPPEENEWGAAAADDDDEHEHHLSWLYHRTIGATPPSPPAGTDADAAAVRFVSIDRRCCCGAPVVRSACEHSASAFTVTTWTLALTTAAAADDDDEPPPMAWVKDGVLDCEEFWALLASYDDGGDEGRRLPRRAWPMCPVVSAEKPDAVCLLVAECANSQAGGKIWTLEVDMRKKILISVVPCPPHPVRCVNYANYLPTKLHCSMLNA